MSDPTLLTVPEAAACRCDVCKALVELAASADANLRRRMAERERRTARRAA